MTTTPKPWGAPTSSDLDRLYYLRAEMFAEIQRMLAEDGHCKSYEGCFEITFPNYFEDKGRAFEEIPPGTHHDSWGLTLHCYLLCSGRRETWTGNSFQECVEKAERWWASYCFARDVEAQA